MTSLQFLLAQTLKTHQSCRILAKEINRVKITVPGIYRGPRKFHQEITKNITEKERKG